MKAATLAWKKLVNRSTNHSDNVHPPLPLKDLQHLTKDLCLKQWVQKGIKDIQDLLHGKTIKPFPQLQKQFTLPLTERYTYMPVSHWLQNILTLPLFNTP